MREHGPDLVRLDQVSVQFNHQTALQNISMHLHDNCITTLIGPNGAGKTTLVRVVLGLIKPSSGNVWRKPGLKIGYMPQKLHIDHTLPLSVERFLSLPKKVDRALMLKALEDVGAGYLLKHSVHNLSGGETQRVLLARALLRDPQLLVLDEPVQGVDINGQLELYQLISDIRKQRQCGVLMISHDLHLVPQHVSNDPSFLELFGPAQASALALYNHHHVHQHDAHGDIIVDHPLPNQSDEHHRG